MPSSAVGKAKAVTEVAKAMDKASDAANAANGSQPNTKQCPTCGKDVKGNPYNNESRNTSDGWDVSHNPSWSNRPQNYNKRTIR